MRLVTAFEILDHGQDAEDYFPGCGVAFTKFDEVYTGQGATPGEALEDAIEGAVCDGELVFSSEHTAEIERDWLGTAWARREVDADAADNDRWHFYVSLRVKIGAETVDLRPYHWHVNNTECHTWFERDRAHVRLCDKFGADIICLWDEDVATFVDDGFKTSRQQWHDALCEYATALKLRAGGAAVRTSPASGCDGPCSDAKCPGFFVDTGGDTMRLVRCDECKVFPDDEAAADAVNKAISDGALAPVFKNRKV